MDEEENVTLCTAAIVIRKSPHSLILVDGSCIISPIAHIPQFSTRVWPYLHVACGNTHKNINIIMCSNTCYLHRLAH